MDGNSVKPRAGSDKEGSYSTPNEGGRPSWVPDDSRTTCIECRAAFGIFTRRHHCRFCGHLVCSSCSSMSVIAKKLTGYNHPLRCCTYCFPQLQIKEEGNKFISDCIEWPYQHIYEAPREGPAEAVYIVQAPPAVILPPVPAKVIL